MALGACDRPAPPPPPPAAPEEPTPRFRNVEAATAYVGDQPCARCHPEAAGSYETRAMARTFHPWSPGARVETTLAPPLPHPPTGFAYRVVELDDALYQEELLLAPDGRPIHQLRRRVDYVMGSGNVARTYFTEENGRLFQLPLTWYRGKGWDFSPGYEVNNARFGRLLPDGCVACHGSYPQTIPFLEGKYATLPPGIGCERCHGPGALHVRERTAGVPPDSGYDDTIVNPERLPIERRLDVCEQCHVHTPVTVLRQGEDAFSYVPSRPLDDHAAFFKVTGSIDVVSHADRLRQSACFIATRSSGRPLECATCHDPHLPGPAPDERNRPCGACHARAALEARLASSPALGEHRAGADCVACHMPRVKERAVPHGSFTEHWIRVVSRAGGAEPARPATGRPLEPYFERDRVGSEAALYQAMGEVVYASRAADAAVLDEAAASLARVIGADTARGDAQFLLGLAYRQLGRTTEAIRALERSLRGDPGRPERLHALARAYESAGRPADAVAPLYERALAAQPALAWIRADYARFLQGRGRRNEAEAAYRAALAERPSLEVAAFGLGTLLTEAGRLVEAAEAFRRAARLDPALGEALASLVQVRTAGGAVVGVRALGMPLETVPVRDRGSRAPRLAVAPGGILFVNVPPGASLHIVEPDGAVVRTLRNDESTTLAWDLLTAAGEPIGGGLYRVQVQGRPALSFGVVRQRS